jgi:uncharacterized protein with von Willebrand factor type A (vWA) domain
MWKRAGPLQRSTVICTRRARCVLWFNPEHSRQWRHGASDMLQYAPLCYAVHRVSNLAEQAETVDRLFD